MTANNAVRGNIPGAGGSGTRKGQADQGSACTKAGGCKK
jgi:hypothetical protein